MNFPHHNPPGASPSLWHTWPSVRVLFLAVLLMSGNFIVQIMAYASGGGLFLPVLLGAVGGVFVPLAIVSRRDQLPWRFDFSLQPAGLPVYLAAALVTVAALAPTSLLAQLSLSLHPPDPQWLGFMADSMPQSAGGVVLAVVTVVLVAPLAEELVFRGLLHRLAARHWGRWPAVVISSLVFGIVHGEPWYLFGLIGVGAVLAVLYEATGSVLVCWVAHMVHNAIALAMMLLSEQPTPEAAPLTLADGLIAGGSLVVLVLLLRYLLQARRTGP